MPAPGSWAPRDLVVNGARPSDEMARFLGDNLYNTTSLSACLTCLSETEKMIALVSTTLAEINTSQSARDAVFGARSAHSTGPVEWSFGPAHPVPEPGDATPRQGGDNGKSIVDVDYIVNGDPEETMSDGQAQEKTLEPVDSGSNVQQRPSVVAENTFGSTFLDFNAPKGELLGQKPAHTGTRMSKLRHFLRSATVEVTFIMVIVANAVVMAIEQEMAGEDLGDQIRRKEDPRIETESSRVFELLETIFCAVFAMEVIVKIFAFGASFFKDPFHYVDVFVVVVSVLELFLESIMPVKSSIIRIVRLIRLGRLMRLVRTLEGFDQLFLMVTAIKGSASVLGWALLLLLTIQLALALAICQILQVSYFEGQSKPNANEQVMWNYFGTFTRAMLSLTEMTVGNWVPICRLLVEDVNEWWMIASLTHKFTIGFAVIGVVNGVFMRETFKVAETDDNIMMRAKKNAMRLHRRKMERLFDSMDLDADGKIDLPEFELITSVPEVKTWLGSMDLRTDDIPLLFGLIDENNNGWISMDEMIAGIANLKGPARSIDMAAAISHIHRYGSDDVPAPRTDGAADTPSAKQ